jgi:hypothetical protein
LWLFRRRFPIENIVVRDILFVIIIGFSRFTSSAFLLGSGLCSCRFVLLCGLFFAARFGCDGGSLQLLLLRFFSGKTIFFSFFVIRFFFLCGFPFIFRDWLLGSGCFLRFGAL